MIKISNQNQSINIDFNVNAKINFLPLIKLINAISDAVASFFSLEFFSTNEPHYETISSEDLRKNSDSAIANKPAPLEVKQTPSQQTTSSREIKQLSQQSHNQEIKEKTTPSSQALFHEVPDGLQTYLKQQDLPPGNYVGIPYMTLHSRTNESVEDKIANMKFDNNLPIYVIAIGYSLFENETKMIGSNLKYPVLRVDARGVNTKTYSLVNKDEFQSKTSPVTPAPVANIQKTQNPVKVDLNPAPRAAVAPAVVAQPQVPIAPLAPIKHTHTVASSKVVPYNQNLSPAVEKKVQKFLDQQSLPEGNYICVGFCTPRAPSQEIMKNDIIPTFEKRSDFNPKLPTYVIAVELMGLGKGIDKVSSGGVPALRLGKQGDSYTIRPSSDSIFKK